MNVLFVTREYPPNVIGGIAIHTYNLVKHLEKIGVACKVISFGDEKDSSEDIIFVNPSSYILEKGPASLSSTSRIPADIIRFSKIANKVIKETKFDIIHVEEPYVGALIKNSSGSVQVSTFHDTSYGEIKSIVEDSINTSSIKRILFYVSLGFSFEFKCINASKMLFVPTPPVKKELIKIYKVPAEKIKIMRNGVVIPNHENNLKKELAKKQLGLNPESILIFSLARLVSRKRLDLLVKAIKVLQGEKLNDFHVVIGGNGPEKPKIASLIKSCNVGDVIEMPGWLSEKQRNLYYQAADIFILPSDYEGFPLTMLEAMSYGIAVVNSKIESLSNMRNEIDSLSFPPGEYLALSDCIRKLLSDHSIRTQLSQSSLRFAKKYDWKDVARETLELYKSLLI